MTINTDTVKQVSHDFGSLLDVHAHKINAAIKKEGAVLLSVHLLPVDTIPTNGGSLHVTLEGIS